MIILVDFENTHASGLEGYTYLNESDTLVMYYSDENSAVTKGVVDDLRKNGVHVRLVKLLKQHSNALDMYIASTTGMFLDSGEKICIVSKDHGYAAVRDFWHSLRGAEILLGETIKQCLLSSELNDEARIRLCKEREQKAMLVDAFTTMNTIPTRPTLSRSNQRRRRNDIRNFMEVSEPVAILPNPLMAETPADQLAKALSSAAEKSERASKVTDDRLQPESPKRQGNMKNTSNDREAQQKLQDAATISIAQEIVMTETQTTDHASGAASVTEAEASTAAGRSERGGRGRNGRNRRNDQNNRNDRKDRQERDDRNVQDRADTTVAEKAGSEQRKGRGADDRTQNARSTREQTNDRRSQNDVSEQTTSDLSTERFGGYDGIMKVNEASRIALDQRQEREEKKAEQDEASSEKSGKHPKQETALVKTEQKTMAIAKVDPNRVQFVWDPLTRSMKRVGGPTEESAEKKVDAPKTADFAESDVESKAVAAKPADAVTESVSDAVIEKNTEAEEKNVVDVNAQISDAAEKHEEVASVTDAVTKTGVETAIDAVTETATDAVTEKTAIDVSKSEDVKHPAVETAAVQLDTTADKASVETAVSGLAAVAGKKKSEAAKKTGAHRKAKKSTTVTKETDAETRSEMNTEKTASASKKATKKSSTKKTEDKSTEADSKKKSVKKDSSENGKAEMSPKKVADDVNADAPDTQPVLEMTEEDIQLTKKKYSEGINTLHTYYVRLMKAFGREQGRAIYESTKKSVQEEIKVRKAQLAAQQTAPEETME